MVPVPWQERAVVFAVGANGNLGFAWDESGPPPTPGVWFTWEDLGQATATPAVGANVTTFQGPELLEVFGMGPDRQLLTAWVTPGRDWSIWNEIAPQILSNPCVGRNREGQLVVLAAGPNGCLGYTVQRTAGDPMAWTSWADVGPDPPHINSDPVAATNSDGFLEVFAAGPDGTLGHLVEQPPPTRPFTVYQPWSNWESINGVIQGNPAVGTNDDGSLDVFALGPFDNLGHTRRVPGGWSGWEDLGPPIQGAPAVAKNFDGRLEVFAVGLEGTLGHNWQASKNDGWQSWETLGPTPSIEAPPAVIPYFEGLHLFAITSPQGSPLSVGMLGHIWQQDGGWSNWEEFPIQVQSGVARGLAAAISG